MSEPRLAVFRVEVELDEHDSGEDARQQVEEDLRIGCYTHVKVSHL